MHICTYINIYTYIHIHVQIHILLHIHMCTYTHIYLHVLCMYMYRSAWKHEQESRRWQNDSSQAGQVHTLKSQHCIYFTQSN